MIADVKNVTSLTDLLERQEELVCLIEKLNQALNNLAGSTVSIRIGGLKPVNLDMFEESSIRKYLVVLKKEALGVLGGYQDKVAELTEAL